MKKNLAKLLVLILALTLVISVFAGCSGDKTPSSDSQPSSDPDSSNSSSEDTQSPTYEYVPTAAQLLAGKEYGTDYVTMYDQYGSEITIDDVQEDEYGLAYIEVDGEVKYLGMDFLSMAMVYKTAVPEGSSYKTEDDVYAAWWKYYITRWNELVPEVPLYSNEYYNFYNAQIKGTDEYPTNPYWGPEKALIEWSSEKADNSIIVGVSTELSGKFRYSNFGASNPGASDLCIENLTSGLDTVVANKEGGYQVNDTAVKEMNVVENEDGTLTYDITLNEDLVFSDGSPITAKNYLYTTLVFSSPVAVEAAGKDHQAGMTYVGFGEFNGYTGEEAEGTSPVFSGLRLLGDYEFSATVSPEYADYFYAVIYAAFTPTYKDLWMGDCDIADDGEGVYITGDFYAKNGDSYVMASHITDSANNTDTTYPYSGAYVVTSYDASDKSAVLTRNPNFKGNYEGVTPSIETVVYKMVITSTQLQDLKSGGIDVLAEVTGGASTNEALTMADDSDGAFTYTHYSRAGYGKLQFRCDYGPTQFTAVRQAVTYCMDRATFAKTFTGGYGGVVDGPYYTGSWMYQAAAADGMILNAYDTSVDTAIAVLEADGWIYNAEGGAYESGVRYKKIPAEYATENDKTYQSIDGAYKTVEIDGDYYMPLAINWYGTADNDFSDQLVTGYEQAENIINAGFVIQKTIGDFPPMLDEFYQAPVYGYYSGTPMYSTFNYATGFTSAVYDYAYNWSFNPAFYDDYSIAYLMDEADICWLS